MTTDEQLLGDLYSIYYNNRDLKLLLDLLAESSGIAPSIRIMSLFDKKFRARSEPKDLKVFILRAWIALIFCILFIVVIDFRLFQLTKEGNDLKVEFDDAPTMKEIFSHIKQV